MKQLLSNKKGNIVNIFYVIVVLFFTAILFLVVSLLQSSLKAPLQEKFGAKADAIVEKGDTLVGVWDNVFFLVFAGFIALLVIIGLATDFHPIFWVFTILIAATAIIVTATFSNAFGELSSTSTLASASAEVAKTSYFMNNAVIFITIAAIIVIIAMFAKPSGGE